MQPRGKPGRPRRRHSAGIDRQRLCSYVSDFREVDGYRMPYRVEAGNMFGTDDDFPFFIGEVTESRFPRASP